MSLISFNSQSPEIEYQPNYFPRVIWHFSWILCTINTIPEAIRVRKWTTPWSSANLFFIFFWGSMPSASPSCRETLESGQILWNLHLNWTKRFWICQRDLLAVFSSLDFHSESHSDIKSYSSSSSSIVNSGNRNEKLFVGSACAWYLVMTELLLKSEAIFYHFFFFTFGECDSPVSV